MQYAIVNSKEKFRDHLGDVFEIIATDYDSFVLSSIFTGTELKVKQHEVAIGKDKIVVFEAPYSRHPEDDYLRVRLIYLVNKNEYVTRIFNYETGGGNAGHYFYPDSKDIKDMSQAFSNAFVDYLDR